MSFDAPEAQPVVIPPPPPMVAERAAPKKQKAKSMQPTFLGAGSVPEVNAPGGKTLLGQ
jgi:hypothetical protein